MPQAAVEFAFECLEHGTRVDEVMAFHIHSMDFKTDDALISRLLLSCINTNNNSTLQLITTTEIFLENMLDQTHPELFLQLLNYLWKLCCGDSELKQTSCLCLKEIELVHPGLLYTRIPSIKPSLEKQVSPLNAPLLLLLTITAHDDKPVQLNVISKTLDSLPAMSRWMRCEVLHLLAAHASSEHILSHPRVVECISIVTSPICLQSMFDLDAIVKTATFRAHLDSLSLAFARDANNPQEWRDFAMRLRIRASMQTAPLPFDMFSFAYQCNQDSLWVVDDFWRDDTLRVAHKAFALYSQILHHSDEYVQHIAKNLIDHVLLLKNSRQKFLPFVIQLVQTNESLLREIAPSVAKCEDISDLFPIVYLLLLIDSNNHAIATLDAFVDGFKYRANANWSVVVEYLDMCCILLQGCCLRNKLKTSPTAVSVLRLVRKMRAKSQVDFILWDACDQIERRFMLDFDENSDSDDSDEDDGYHVIDVDFSEYFELKCVRDNTKLVSLEWKHAWKNVETTLVGMEIYVDLEQTSSACYDFSLEPRSIAQISAFALGNCETFSFTLPTSELCLPVRVFFSCMASTSNGDTTYRGSLGSISYELDDLFVRVARIPAAFTPVARVCICLQERPLQRVLDFIRATFGISKNEGGEDDMSWKLCVRLPPSSHLAFNLHYHVPTQTFTARVQTDLWLVLPELDKLFQRI